MRAGQEAATGPSWGEAHAWGAFGSEAGAAAAASLHATDTDTDTDTDTGADTDTGGSLLEREAAGH